MTNRLKILIILLACMGILSTVSAVWNWISPPQVITQTEYVSVPEIKEVVKIKRVEVPGPERIITIEKEKIVEKLHLPEWFSGDANLQAIATAVVAPYEGDTNVVATLNTETGAGNIIARREPLSFMALESKTYFYLKPGISTRGDFPFSGGVYRQLLRIKNVHVGGYGEGSVRLDAGSLERPEVVAGLVLYW